eukprot:CAMPEP_0185697458 /NCGR_PEP_ID=MMETSP1164-20130828/5756_1 /TAXON_ID=1104430 /ORGANISM="Chrysoreinhardia sp, Strain CCMP2950" /LENGTH=564 /DNA_ID=CAMNT_0028364355 /DNA_START=33 /DNA_END=1727 /DNA_ORIENTATION=-
MRDAPDPEGALVPPRSWGAAATRDDRHEGFVSRVLRSNNLHLILPGVMAGLTNSDVAAVVTYTQSGAKFGLASVKFQILVAPCMYAFQELGARLGAATGQGLLAIVRDDLGDRAAAGVLGVLVLSTSSTLFCEACGVAAAAELWSIPQWSAMAVYTAVLCSSVVYRASRVGEGLSVALASLLSFFVILAGIAIGDRPPSYLGDGDVLALDVSSSGYDLIVVSASIGSALTPFLCYYQQAAAMEARATVADVPALRVNAVVGVCLSVLCSVAITVSAAYEFWGHHHRGGIRSIQDCGEAFREQLGPAGRWIFSLGLVGAATTSSTCALGALIMGWADLRQAQLLYPKVAVAAARQRGEPPPPPVLGDASASTLSWAGPAQDEQRLVRGRAVASVVVPAAAAAAAPHASGASSSLPPSRPYAAHASRDVEHDDKLPLLGGSGSSSIPRGVRASSSSSGDADHVICVDASYPAAALGFGVLLVVALLVLWTTEAEQVHLEVLAQDLDCVLIPAALALALYVARRHLPRSMYSDTEYAVHVVGSIVVSFVGLAPLVAAAAIRIAQATR